MIDVPGLIDPQGMRDILVEGITRLSAVEMNRVLQNCGYAGQRTVNQRHVLVLADLMTRGRWTPKSQLDFAVLAGRFILVNGYHRAHAQVRSGKTIEWSIALHSCDCEADVQALYYTFDTNVRARGSKDILDAVGFADHHGLSKEGAKALYNATGFLASRFVLDPTRRNFLVEKQVDRRLALASEYAKPMARYEACLDGVMAARKSQFRSGGMTAVAVVTFRYQSEAAWAFWTGVASNDGLKRGDPRLALFNDCLTRRGQGGAYNTIAPAIIAWNAFYQERELKLIKLLDTFVPIIDGTPFDGRAHDGKPVRGA